MLISEGTAAIRYRIKQEQANLNARQNELGKARAYVAEVEQACVRLKDKIAELKRDEQALARGLMGDAASAA
jgi:phage shock protein A